MNRLLALSCSFCVAITLFSCTNLPVQADVSLPAVFGSKMVLQREARNRVWGTADPGESVTVTIAEQTHTTAADDDGAWGVTLDELETGGPYKMLIEGKNRVEFEDVLVGEVWVCSGQSNMAWAVQSSNDADLEILAANYPRIRLLSIPQVGTQEPQVTFNGQWKTCTPETVADFSAVGFYFGRQLHQTLDVPVGLIDNAWGGSACEAWIPRDVLAGDPQYAPLLERWTEIEETFDYEQRLEQFETRLAKWQEAAAEARKAGQAVPRRPARPRNVLVGQHRPGNLYNGVLNPIIGYGIRGAIWYQGEHNASRAYQYRELFPLMIEQWRQDWEIGDFPFYWVQLADFMAEVDQPSESAWAELREAQTMTAKRVPNSGQAVIIDLGEAADIHPRNKQDVGMRLARLALAKDYGIDVVAESPAFDSLSIDDGKATLKFTNVGGGLDTFDVREPIGFAIAGADQEFVWAKARIVNKETIEVWSPDIKEPVAVRYAWADNPVCNVQNREGLPLTPFRTDDWKGVTADAR